MEDVLRRLGSLEKDVSVIKTDVAGITALLPYLATKAGVAVIKADVAGIAALIPHLATKADLSDLKASIIQWMVSTVIVVAALAFTIAKFVH